MHTYFRKAYIHNLLAFNALLIDTAMLFKAPNPLPQFYD